MGLELGVQQSEHRLPLIQISAHIILALQRIKWTALHLLAQLDFHYLYWMLQMAKTIKKKIGFVIY